MMTADKCIRVLIVDDHPMVLDGLQTFISLSADLECVGQAQNGEEAIALCETLQPDVVLMDLVMPGMGGIYAIRAIRAHNNTVQVVALTSFAEPELVQQALEAGAIGYVLKHVRASELANVIRSARSRRSVMAPEATEALVQAMHRNQPAAVELSERELAVLELVVEGLTNAEIAARLWIVESTVRFHVSNILSKLGARNRAEAVRLAFEYGLAPIPPAQGRRTHNH
jgi:NarL family two-component system response regulator LiaR